jgi:hypothetical protein
VKIANFIVDLDSHPFDKNSKITLLNLLKQASENHQEKLQAQLLEVCKQYDQYLEQNQHSNLPPSPTFKDAYQAACNLEITSYRLDRFDYGRGDLSVNIPIREDLIFLKDLKSAIVNELIEQGQIRPFNREVAENRIIIGEKNSSFNMKDPVYKSSELSFEFDVRGLAGLFI